MAKRGPKKHKKRRAVRGKARRAFRAARRFVRRHRVPKLSILAKTGVGIATVVPPAFSALDAGAAFFNATDVVILDRLKLGAASFVDDFSQGFGLGKVFNTIPVQNVSGAIQVRATTTSAPVAGWLKTTALGLTTLIYDAVQSLIVNFATRRKSGVKAFGIQLTSGK